MLTMLEYCSPVCMSTAVFHLRLLDYVVSKAKRLSDGLMVCDLEHRRCFAALRMFYKICDNPAHALEAALPMVSVPVRLTRPVVFIHLRYLGVPRSRTVQSSRLSELSRARYWNSLDEPCFAGDGTAALKV